MLKMQNPEHSPIPVEEIAQFEFATQTYEGNSVQVPLPPSEVYEYCRPGVGEVRILSLHEAGDDTDEFIECDLWYAPLKKIHNFTALSYLWGDPSYFKVIVVNKSYFPVTANCFSALIQLRKQGRQNLWIDAICINQQDLDEKEILIRGMRDIFHSATCVIAWLGAAESGSTELMRMLYLMYESRRPTESGEKNVPLTPDNKTLNSLKESALALLDRSYWRRAWVTQEIGLASRLLISCGPVHTSWRGLELFLESFSPYLNTISEVSRNDLEGMQHINRLCTLRRSRIEGVPSGLLEVLQNCVDTLATKPRDKIYALLALSYDSPDFVSKLDYDESTSLDHICMDITKNVIWSKRSLDIIFFGKKKIPRETLPSWCPDYTGLEPSLINDKLAKYLSGSDERFRSARRCRRWNTFGGEVLTHDQIEISQDHVLIASGIKHSTINGLGSTADGEFEHKYALFKLVGPREANKVLFNRIGRALSLYKVEQQKASQESQALWDVFDFEKVIKDGVGTLDDWQIIRSWKAHNQDFKVCGKSLKERGTNLRAKHESGYIDHYAHSLFNATWIHGWGGGLVGPAAAVISLAEGRKPALSLGDTLSAMADLMKEGLRIMTTNLNNIGWAHPSARVGDEIFLISGCSMPAILRKSEKYPGSYSVVGHVYLEGVMDNEFWSKTHPSKLEKVHLR